MDFSDFLRRLGAEPRSRDPGLLAAREQSARHQQAAAEAEAFEQRLETALLVPVDGAALTRELLDNIEQPGTRARWPWLAMAASVLVMVGVASLLLRSAPPQDLERYVQEHFEHDGAAVLAMAQGLSDPAQLEETLAQLGAEASETLNRQVLFVKFCPTPHGRGAHMVVQSAQGPVTVIFMPDTQVTETRLVRFDGMQASVIALAAGSAAIIGKTGQDDAAMQSLLRNSILPRSS